MAKINKAMILAAGFGTRLAPITDSLPKPLVPVINIPNIVHSIHLLSRAGIKDIIINTHYLGDQISTYLESSSLSHVNLSFSPEKILLGTGGGVKKAGPFFGDEPFVVCNSDFITDIDLAPVIERHFEKSALATMVLVDDETKKQKYAAVGTNKDGLLCSLPKHQTAPAQKSGFFTGIHVLDNSVLAHLEEKPSGINLVLYPALMNKAPNQVFGDYVTPRFWMDTGEIPEFLQASMQLLKALGEKDCPQRELLTSSGYEERKNGIWTTANPPKLNESSSHLLVGSDVKIESTESLGSNVVVGDGCTIGKGARVENSCLLPGAKIAAGAHVDQAIVLGDRILSRK